MQKGRKYLNSSPVKDKMLVEDGLTEWKYSVSTNILSLTKHASHIFCAETKIFDADFGYNILKGFSPVKKVKAV